MSFEVLRMPENTKSHEFNRFYRKPMILSPGTQKIRLPKESLYFLPPQASEHVVRKANVCFSPCLEKKAIILEEYI